MKTKNKSIKIILILIAIIIFFMLLIGILNYNGYLILGKKEIISDDIEYPKTELAEGLTYYYDSDIGTYMIYDKDDNLINMVYQESELEFYKDNPDFNANFGIYQSAGEDGISDNIDD